MFLVGTTPLDKPYGWQLGRGGRGRAAYAYLWDWACSSQQLDVNICLLSARISGLVLWCFRGGNRGPMIHPRESTEGGDPWKNTAEYTPRWRYLV